MLLWLLENAEQWLPAGAAAWGKITFRAAVASAAAFLLAVLLGPRLIAFLQSRFRERIDSASPELNRIHQGKQYTPTMGGLFIMAGVLGSLALCGQWSNRFVVAAAVLIVGFTLVGWLDDLVKLRSRSRGLSSRAKLLGQTLAAAPVAWLLYGALDAAPSGHDLALPGGAVLPLGIGFIPWAVLVLVGTSNAVNLADGLDGLAGGCLAIATAGLTALAYCAGHAQWAEYLAITPVPGAGEMAVLGATMIGALAGFLWFNCHPAQVFMGDTGSLPLGALLGLLALAARGELLLLIIGGVFVAEAVSVIAQVVWFRSTGRRLLRCAPLHHHYQFLGVPESKIVVRFWIAAALCVAVAFGVVKMRIHDNRPIGPHIGPDTPATASLTWPDRGTLTGAIRR